MNSDVSVQIKDEDDINWDEITDDKLQDLLVNMVRMKMILDLENDFFYRYLQRNDPESLKSKQYSDIF
ncbi:coiled-coil domain-containing protein 113 [Vespula maculifrons]|uniref:Coiled-coil domain-containing protein 113 n=1 Tax=Vespula maculifrons TaxID=7453 RepID=A0ABD2CXR5_VESMC